MWYWRLSPGHHILGKQITKWAPDQVPTTETSELKHKGKKVLDEHSWIYTTSSKHLKLPGKAWGFLLRANPLWACLQMAGCSPPWVHVFCKSERLAFVSRPHRMLRITFCPSQCLHSVPTTASTQTSVLTRGRSRSSAFSLFEPGPQGGQSWTWCVVETAL